MLVTVVAANVADFVITVSTSLVDDRILTALASAVVGAVVASCVRVGMHMYRLGVSAHITIAVNIGTRQGQN